MSRRTWWLLAVGVGSFALAASANSAVNGFTYDDIELIQRAPRMHSMDGWWREFAHTYWPETQGGDAYRPFTILAYKLEWLLGGGSPMPFHVVNIAVHVTTAIAVFWLMCAFLPAGAAWIGAALYAVHPVHVESVANVVGQAELIIALMLALASALYLHGRRAGALSRGRWFAIAALYAVGCMFKEQAIVLPALLLIAEMTIVVDKAPLWQRLTAMRPAYLAIALIGTAYLGVRSQVVIGGFGGFQLFVVFEALELSAANRVLTMIGLTPEWLRLLLWPARLTTEYSPPFIEVAQGVSLTQLPGLLVLLGTIGLAVACWRRSPVTTFGIAWLVITLLPASNFLIPAGFIIAERTLLSPSIGAMVAVASTVPWIYERIEASALMRRIGELAVLVLLALGVARSITRNRAWHDNETLFRDNIVESPDSYRAHFMLGAWLFENRRMAEGERYTREALRLFPHDAVMFYALAERYRMAGFCEPAITFYRALFALRPDAVQGRLGFAACLLETFHLDDARRESLAAIRVGARYTKAREIIAASRAAADSLAARRARGETTVPVPVRLPPS